MSITTETNRLEFVGDGVDNSPYAISFPLRDDDSVQVLYVTVATGAEVVKVNITDYTIALAADFVTANLTLVTAAPATGVNLVIIRDEPATRLSNYRNFDGQPSATLNADYDKGTMQDLTLQEQVDRTIRVAIGHPNADLPLTPLNLIGAAGRTIVVKSDESDFELILDSIADGTITPAKLLDGTDNQVIQMDTTLGEWEFRDDITLNGTVSLKEQAEANPNVATFGQFWVKTATPNEPWFDDDAGTERQLMQGDGSTVTDQQFPIFDGTTGGLFKQSALVQGGTNVVTCAGITLEAELSRVGGPITLLASNLDNTNPASNAQVRARVAGASGGDPFISWEILLNTLWSMGLDNSDSDKLVLSRDQFLGTNNVFEADGSTGDFTIKTTLTVDGISTLTGDVTAVGDVTLSAGSLIISAGMLNIGLPSVVTIVSGAITVTRSHHGIAGEGGAADNLDTINGGNTGDILIIRSSSSANDITCTEVGNLRLGATTRVLTHTNDKLFLLFEGSNWTEISFSDNQV